MTTEFGLWSEFCKTWLKNPDQIQIRKLDYPGVLVKFQRDLDQNSFKELDDHGILVKFFKDFDQIFLGSTSIQQIRWQSNSSRSPDQYLDQKIRWPWNSCKIPKGFSSEFFKNVDQNSFLKLDNHGILMKFF